jgi:uncharacterized damage-inducible protein DinB
MTARAQRLHETGDAQIAELIERLASAGQAALVRPCPRREKLGDGTVGGVAAHIAGNYLRIARFVTSGGESDAGERAGQHAAAASIELDDLLARLGAARNALAAIAQLTDEQLDAVPPASAMKFTDGERTREQILTRLLNHQRHQLDAVAAGLS